MVTPLNQKYQTMNWIGRYFWFCLCVCVQLKNKVRRKRKERKILIFFEYFLSFIFCEVFIFSGIKLLTYIPNKNDMNSHDTFLLNLFVVMILNNLASMYIYELSLRTFKTPLIVKCFCFLTAFITLAIWFVFLLEFYAYLREIYTTVSQTYHF